jgi:hypothetical protein
MVDVVVMPRQIGQHRLVFESQIGHRTPTVDQALRPKKLGPVGLSSARSKAPSPLRVASQIGINQENRGLFGHFYFTF